MAVLGDAQELGHLDRSWLHVAARSYHSPSTRTALFVASIAARWHPGLHYQW